MILNQVDRQFNKVESILDSIESGDQEQNRTVISSDTEIMSNSNLGIHVNYGGSHVENSNSDKVGQSEINSVARPFAPRSEKTGLRGFRLGPTQTGLYNQGRWLEA